MTAKNGGSGFDADKFRKLFAMCDSDHIEEAITAFKLAGAELKKAQLRFCDRLVDSDEARELAEIECARVRDELNRIFDLCARRQADVDDAHEIIDRLHERIAAMERKAGTKAAKYARKKSAEDMETVAEPPDETELDASDYWEIVPPPPITPTPGKASEQGASYRLPALPVWKSAYWLGLLCFVFMYVCAVVGQGHLLTTSEWQSRNLVADFALLFAMTGFLYMIGWKLLDFSQTWVGQWSIRNFGSVGDMVAAPLCLMTLNIVAYGFFDQAPDEVALPQFLIFCLVFGTLYIRHLLKNFGWAGVGIKALMLFDGVCIAASLLKGDFPWWTDLHNGHAMVRHPLDALYFVIGWGIMFTLDTPTRWAIQHSRVRHFFYGFALFFLSYGAVMVADYAVEGHKPQPAVIEQAQPSHAKPKHKALLVAPPHSPVLLATVLLTPQPYTYQPYRYQPYSAPKSNADIVRGWCRDLKAFFDDLIGEQAEEGIIGLIVLRWLWKVSQNAKDRRIKRKAIERALNPPMPRNIHGDAGFVDRSRAKRQGWI